MRHWRRINFTFLTCQKTCKTAEKWVPKLGHRSLFDTAIFCVILYHFINKWCITVRKILGYMCWIMYSDNIIIWNISIALNPQWAQRAYISCVSEAIDMSFSKILYQNIALLITRFRWITLISCTRNVTYIKMCAHDSRMNTICVINSFFNIAKSTYGMKIYAKYNVLAALCGASNIDSHTDFEQRLYSQNGVLHQTIMKPIFISGANIWCKVWV